MVYPRFGTSCPTNPLVSFRDITLRNVTAVDGLNDYAGMIIADEANPATNVVFESVHIQQGKKQDYTLPFVTRNVYGSTSDCIPDLEFLV